MTTYERLYPSYSPTVYVVIVVKYFLLHVIRRQDSAQVKNQYVTMCTIFAGDLLPV